MTLETLIAKRIKEAREEAGLSLEALGVLAGIEEATAKVRIHQYEQGKHAPPFRMLERLAEALKKPVVWFVCDEAEKSLIVKLSELPQSTRYETVQKLEQALASRASQSR